MRPCLSGRSGADHAASWARPNHVAMGAATSSDLPGRVRVLMPMSTQSRSVEDDVFVLRLVGLLLILLFTGLGVVLLVEGQGATRVLGFVFVLTGATWFSVDLLRRRGVI